MSEVLITRILNQTIFSAGCWEWSGYKIGRGYGRISHNHKNYRVHRVSYEFFHGVKLEELFCCHHCDNPSCVNPLHLFAGTHQDNVDDNVKKGRHRNSIKTHCKRGHLLDGDNLYIIPNREARNCRKCKKIAKDKFEKYKREKSCQL